MTVKVLLTVGYMWLTLTTLANGQYYPGAPSNIYNPQSQQPGNQFTQPNGQQNAFSPGGHVPGNQYMQPNGQQNFYSPGGQVPGFGSNPQTINPQNRPNSNTFSPQSFNAPQAMDPSSLLPPGFAPFPVNQPTSLGPQNAASYNPTFPPQRPSPSYSYPHQTSPYNTGPQDPSSFSPNLQPRDSFPTNPGQTSPFFSQPTSEIYNPSNLRHQSQNPIFPVPQQTNPDYPRPQQIPQDSRRPQQIPQDSRRPQIPQDSRRPQQIPQDYRRPQQIPQDYRRPQQIPRHSRRSQQTNTGPQQSNFVPPTGPQQSNFGSPTVPEPTNLDSTSPQQIPQGPTGPQQTNTDFASPQQSHSAPPTTSQLTDSGSTVPQQTDSGSTVPQKSDSGPTDPQKTDSVSTVPQQTDSYPTGSQTANPASDGSQPITQESQPPSSVAKASQDTGSMPTEHQHPSHSHRPNNRPPPGKEMHSHPSGDPLGGLRILCLFNNKHYYKNGFTPAQLEPHLCTHLNYEFAILDPKTYEMIVGYPSLDVELRFYEEAVGLKKINPRLKCMMSLGGWADSTKKYSEMAADPSKRHNFIKKAVPFLQKHGFDGLDLAWEYPNCWQGALGVSPKDKQNFVILLKEMKPEFEKNNLLLSVSVGAIKREVEAAYDVPEISKTVDYINVMTYDMHGPWEPKTGIHTQFEPLPGDKDKYCNVKGGMEVWIEKGASKKKLNMGLAFYGRSFKMEDSTKCALGVPANKAGDSGPITKEGGILSYHEICNFLNAGNWTEKMEKRAGSYACSGDQFVGYDNPMMMVNKTGYVCEKGLGGVLVKDLSGDDSKGECFNMPFPLLKMVKLEMMHRVRRMNS